MCHAALLLPTCPYRGHSPFERGRLTVKPPVQPPGCKQLMQKTLLACVKTK